MAVDLKVSLALSAVRSLQMATRLFAIDMQGVHWLHWQLFTRVVDELQAYYESVLIIVLFHALKAAHSAGPTYTSLTN